MARSGGEEKTGRVGGGVWDRGVGAHVSFFGVFPDVDRGCTLLSLRSYPRRFRRFFGLLEETQSVDGSLPPPPSDAHRQPPGAQQPARQDQPRACQLSACLLLRPSTMGSLRLFSRLSSSALQSFPALSSRSSVRCSSNGRPSGCLRGCRDTDALGKRTTAP